MQPGKTMSEIATSTALIPDVPRGEWHLPSRGTVGMLCLIVAEAAIFIIFVVAYIFYIGKSLTGPYPHDVLELPIFTTLCLLSSSVTVHLAVSSLGSGRRSRCTMWLAATVLLGAIFLAGTAFEWYKLIVRDGLTIRTNLFGTTFYSLVGLHASHVIVGLGMLSLALVFSIRGDMDRTHADRLNILSYYWHFVDAVWVVVFLVVYVLGR
jgi:cytochrome c oxidase subunit 3